MRQVQEEECNVLLLRFFERQNIKTVSKTLGLDESAVRQNMNRGLEQLCVFLNKRSIKRTAPEIAYLMAANSMQEVPARASPQQ
jgi:DNA-directed RNA polymerase specialized sigma24 family protein